MFRIYNKDKIFLILVLYLYAMYTDFLHHIWAFQLFRSTPLSTTQKETLQIIDKGQRLPRNGPDIFSAQIILNQQHWVGNVALYVNASDWYLHDCSSDFVPDNVILHVVWNHDLNVFRSDQSVVPTLELKHLVSEELLQNWCDLKKQKPWV